MYKPLKALIFDMDGVLIDSEPLWRKAMVNGFNGAGIPFTEEDCRKTTGMRFKEVVEIWLSHHQIPLGHTELEKSVLDLLITLISEEGKAIDGAMNIYEYSRDKKLKIGLATSSPQILVKSVLKKLSLENSFDVVVSAENMKHGKPHPEVFLECAGLLGVQPNECVVIEDSVNGVIAAKAAQMRVFAVPDAEHKNLKQFAAADWQCENMKQVLQQFKELI